MQIVKSTPPSPTFGVNALGGEILKRCCECRQYLPPRCFHRRKHGGRIQGRCRWCNNDRPNRRRKVSPTPQHPPPPLPNPNEVAAYWGNDAGAAWLAALNAQSIWPGKSSFVPYVHVAMSRAVHRSRHLDGGHHKVNGLWVWPIPFSQLHEKEPQL